MPITATYEVQCDTCLGYMDGRYDTREDANDARKELGWIDLNGGTACPDHNPAASAAGETVHGLPVEGSGLTPCCGRTPFELPRTDRMTQDEANVTCSAAAGESGSSADELSTSDADHREPCGEGHCRCYGTGVEHADCACGCDCPRDEDGQPIDD